MPSRITVEKGPVYLALTVESSLSEGPAPARIRQTAVLYHDLKRIDLRNHVDKAPTISKEQVYFAFPFRVGGPPVLHMELPYAVMRWDRDILPGAWKGYEGIANWARLSGSDLAVTWSSVQSPVISAGGINSNRWDPDWHKSYVPSNAHLYSYIMSNMWNRNYPMWQGGSFPFDYSFTSSQPAAPLSESARFGRATVTPLLASIGDSHQGAWPTEGFSAASVSPDNVMITALKQAEGTDGWVIRLFETGGERARIKLTIPGRRPKQAARVNLVEEHVADLAVEAGVVAFEMQPHELASVLIR